MEQSKKKAKEKAMKRAMKQAATSIDKTISYYMVDNKLTREQMAAKMGMSVNTLRWKREGKNEWLLSEVILLSEITGKSPDELTDFDALVVA